MYNMKTINRIRKTDKFCITSCHIDHMAKIQKHFKNMGDSLVCIANDGVQIDHYTVRVATKLNGLYDAVVRVVNDVRVVEYEWIIRGQ